MTRKKQPKPVRGRPPTTADLTAILTVKIAPVDHEELTEIAAGMGLTYGGRGAPGPLARRVLAAYLHDPEIRRRVDGYRA